MMYRAYPGGGGGQEGHLIRASSSKDVQISKYFGDDIIFLKRIYSVNFKLACKLTELLQGILELEVSGVFTNIALRISVSLPSSVASGGYHFSVLKHVKNFYRSTMVQHF